MWGLLRMTRQPTFPELGGLAPSMNGPVECFCIYTEFTQTLRMRRTMPATAPPLGTAAAHQLERLGRSIRARRKQLRVSATAAAEAAGMSRVTLHRIERGAASVAAGAYVNAAAALGLRLVLGEEPVATPEPRGDAPHALPATVRLADFPALRRLAWQLRDVTELTPQEALNLYERNWRHVDTQHMDEAERLLVSTLARELSGGRLLV